MSGVRPLVRSVAALAVLGVAGCGTPAPSPTPAPTRVPATPTPLPPDTESVTVAATGVGTWQLVAIPVAVLHNQASRHGAVQVTVHFTTRSPRGAVEGSLDSQPVNLAPGETLAVAGDCTDACNGASGTDVMVSVTAWTSVPGSSFASSQVAYRCGTGACGGGHGEGDVTGVLSTRRLAPGATVAAFAACTGPGGAIVGGGSTQLVWPGGPSFAVSVPVIVNSSPAACRLGASTGW
jgi:hypothetical protein